MKKLIKCSKEAELAEMMVMTRDIHKAMFGNGRDGMLEKFHKLEGGLAIFKWLGGGGGLLGLISLLIMIIKVVK